MKKTASAIIPIFIRQFIIFLLAGLALSVQPALAQDSTQSSSVLTSYYGIKDALVTGKAADAALKAGEFAQALSSLDEKAPADTRNTLAEQAKQMAKSKDIIQQRAIFTTISANMIVLAKAVRLTGDPVYQQYCPMKKSSWLSSSKAIKNPYYGNSMLTCGQVKETL